MNDIQLYPARAHLLTQEPVWVELDLSDITDITKRYISYSDYANRISLLVRDVAFTDKATRMYVKLSVSNISANCVPYTANITPNTHIFTIITEE